MSDNPYQSPEVLSAEVVTHHPQYSRLKSLKTRAKFAQILLLLMLVVTVSLSVVMNSAMFDELVMIEDEVSNYEVSEDLLAYAQLVGSLGMGLIAVFIVCVIAVCMWTHRAMSNTWSIVDEKPAMTPGWAVGWYFIPVMNLWKPYQGMKAIWEIAFGHNRGTGILLVWWFAWVISNITERMAQKTDANVNSPLYMTSLFLTVIAGLTLVYIIQKVTVNHEERLLSNV